MASQVRVKPYLEQSLCLAYQCVSLIPKYWLDAKIDPGSKRVQEIKVQEKTSTKGYEIRGVLAAEIWNMC